MHLLSISCSVFDISALVAPGKDEWQVGSLDPDSVQAMVRDLMDAQQRRREEVFARIGRGCEVLMSKGVLPAFAVGDYRACGKSQTARHHAETYEYVDRTVEGGIKNRRTRVRCGRHRHGAFARGTHRADAAVCPCIAQRHRGAEGGIQ